MKCYAFAFPASVSIQFGRKQDETNMIDEY